MNAKIVSMLETTCEKIITSPFSNIMFMLIP